jgi:hypothetical protein
MRTTNAHNFSTSNERSFPMIRKSVSPSPRKRATALVATGALVALGSVLLSASAANAVTQTPAPAFNYSTLVTTNPVNRANTVPSPSDKFVLTDASSKSVQVPAFVVQGDQAGDKVWAVADANNTTNATTHFGLFFYIPSTHNLVDVGSHAAGFNSTSTVGVVPKAAYNATAATAELESLAPGTEYDVIVGQTPFASGGAAGDPSVLLPNENYYEMQYQYDGLNTTSGVYESGVIGTTVNTAPVANTTTALTATADANGGVVLTATIEDATTSAVDTTATGGVDFSAAGLSDVTAQVVNGVATTTISYPTTNYATTYSFTAVYSGDVSFATSTSTAQSVTTAAAPANFGSIGSNEIVTIPAPAAGTLTLSVATGGVQFGTAVADLVHGTFSATAALPESTVTDTRFAKGDWTLNGVSTALVSGSNSIPASDLSWAVPTITTPTGSGAVAGPAAASLATAQSLATFHNGALLGQIITKADTTLSLTTPINQTPGTYNGTLTITLL